MTPTNTLDLEGNFLAYPLAELLIEINTARLEGSLRITSENQKAVIYFQKGELVYAVSNSRSARLFDILLRENKIGKKVLVEIPNFTSDFELAKALIEKKLFTKEAIDALFSRQIEEFLQSAVRWSSGKWVFSPLARIREGISFKINVSKILADYARELASEKAFHRFRSMRETFTAKPISEAQINLQPHEAFVLSRFSPGTSLTIEEIITLSGLPDGATFQTLYVLWLGGFLIRKNWNAPFTEHKLAHIFTARLQLKKQAAPLSSSLSPATIEMLQPACEEPEETPAGETVEEGLINLEEYLTQVEEATNFYEMLGVSVNAKTGEIKQAYFAFAKRFHPDLFHRTAAPELFKKIQDTFTNIAQAYDTLRDKDLREIYDFKLRKELAEMEARLAKGAVGSEGTEAERKAFIASEQFEQGYNLLMDEYYEEAAPYLARAAHLVSDNARYHAFYGKALSYDSTQRHKAESEIQTAIRLDPNNELYRIISAEFFIHYGLLKRAEGELKRLLAVAPNNAEANALLDSLQDK